MWRGLSRGSGPHDRLVPLPVVPRRHQRSRPPLSLMTDRTVAVLCAVSQQRSASRRAKESDPEVMLGLVLMSLSAVAVLLTVAAVLTVLL